MSENDSTSSPPPADEPGESAVPLSRWFFALPEPLPFPDKTQLVDRVANAPTAGEDADPMVSVIVHQVENPYGRWRGATAAVFQVLQRVPGLPNTTQNEDREAGPEISAHYTVIEAVSRADSPEPPPDDWTGDPQDLPPRADDFMRCLRFVTDLVRAYRMATEMPVGLPGYPQIAFPVVRFGAEGRDELVTHNGLQVRLVRPVEQWQGPQLIFLEHTNLPDPTLASIFRDLSGSGWPAALGPWAG